MPLTRHHIDRIRIRYQTFCCVFFFFVKSTFLVVLVLLFCVLGMWLAKVRASAIVVLQRKLSLCEFHVVEMSEKRPHTQTNKLNVSCEL